MSGEGNPESGERNPESGNGIQNAEFRIQNSSTEFLGAAAYTDRIDEVPVAVNGRLRPQVLIVFLLVDALFASVQVLWEKRTLGAFFLLFALRSPMSVILAAIWNAIDKG